eukprot:m.91381 g.91381  ORF g.91381 m.91381 type:complete len:193 (+) comp26462_c0_seq4:402-980(+)
MRYQNVRPNMPNFRYYVFDPFLIILQILTIQCFFYVALAVVLHWVAASASTPLSIDLLFTSKAMTIWQVKAAYLMVAPISGGLIGWIVGRAKQCLDFAATIHVLHLVFTMFYATFPTTASWWVVNTVSAAITASVAEYVSMNINLEAIRVTNPKAASNRSPKKSKEKLRQSDAHTQRSSSFSHGGKIGDDSL